MNFDDHLHDAIRINYLGTLQVLTLAQQCRNLKSFTHVSTAYVNSNRYNFIEEKIYDLHSDQDPEEIIASILRRDPEFVKNNEASLIYSYPNTYTFTKSMAERAIKKLRGNLPISIVRPTVVISSYKEPVCGWTDTLAAGGILVLVINNGYLKLTNFDGDVNFDCIPVDYSCNTILAAAAYTALAPPALNVIHSGTSHLNPVKVGEIMTRLARFAQLYPPEQPIRDPGAKVILDERQYNIERFAKETLPAKLLELAGKLPLIGSKTLQSQAA